MSPSGPAKTPAFGHLRDLVAGMKHAAVVAVGDIMLDRFIYGEVDRISPESPVPVLSVREERLMLGGVGNVLSNLAGLGVEARVIGVVGADEAAGQIRKLVQEKGADEADLVTAAARPSTVKARFLAARQQLLRADWELAVPIDQLTERKVLERATARLAGAGALILSDYGKGVLTPSLIAALIEAARARGILVLVDPKGADYTIYRGASIVTPNRRELAEATAGHATGTDDEVAAAARQLMRQAGIGAVVATRSQDGMTIVEEARAQPLHLRTEAREVFDVSGAGDTVIATLAAGLAAGAGLVDAAIVANAAAGLVVAKVGTAPVRGAELLTALDRRELGISAQAGGSVLDTAREAPLCSVAEGVEIAARWKARGLRVGFTNGCFDILHRGHVTYLNRARDACDRLIVALNEDDSVRRLKGAGRPLNDEAARAAVLGALGAVDMVVMFGTAEADRDKPLRLLEALRPALYFKGGDYRAEELEETALVRSWGGEVAIMPFYNGHSTTSTIEKIQGR